MRLFVTADRHQALRVAHGDGHVAREKVLRMAQRRQSLVPVTCLHLGLSECGVEQRETFVLLDELGKNLLRLFRPASCRQSERIAVLHSNSVLAVVDSRDELLRDIRVRIRRDNAHALTDQLVAVRLLHLAKVAELRSTRTRFGDSIRGDRVVVEHRREVGLRESFDAADFLEEIGHGIGVETGAIQVLDADAVGFLLVGACEVDLLLGREALRGSHAALDGLTASASTDGP